MTPGPFDRIRLFAERHGVTVSVVARVPAIHEAPFLHTVGLDWDALVLYVDDSATADPGTIGAMIHEMGHLIATRTRPDFARELDFTAWEWFVAGRLRVLRAWMSHMSNYCIDTGNEFGELDRCGRLAFLRRMVERGRKAGNIGVDGRLVMLRGSRV